MFLPSWLKRICCVLLALVFCAACVLAPIRARALVLTTASVVGVSAFLAVSAILLALGISQGTDTTGFTEFTHWVGSGLDTSWYVNHNGTASGFLPFLFINGYYYAQDALVQDILDIALDSGALDISYHLPDFQVDTPFYNSMPLSAWYASASSVMSGLYVSGYRYCYAGVQSAYCSVLVFSQSPAQLTTTNGLVTGSFDGPFRVYTVDYAMNQPRINFSKEYDSGSYWLTDQSLFRLVRSDASFLATSDFVTVGNLAENLDDDVYSEWGNLRLLPPPSSAGSGSGGDSSGRSYWPIYLSAGLAGLAASVLELQKLAQEGGASELSPDDVIQTDEEVEIDVENSPGADRLPDVDPAPDPDPTPNPDTAPSSGTISNSGNTDPNDFMLGDLTRFFPFCIPFDLYRMLSCLAAEPETPKFDLALPLPDGSFAEFTIDLSIWDGIAATVRMFEVVIFCIGLSMATRKFIKW